MMENLYIGIEIGATKQQAALGTADGRLLHTITGKIPLPRGAQDVLDWLSAKVPELLRMEERFGGRVRSLAAGFGGEIESSTGRTLNSVQVPGWEDFPLRGWLEETFSMPAEVLNDTVSGGFSELYLGRGKEAGNVFYTNIGSGIGGALFIDRVYYDGVGYGAAYFGNTYIPDWQSPEPGAMTRWRRSAPGSGSNGGCAGRDMSPRARGSWRCAGGTRRGSAAGCWRTRPARGPLRAGGGRPDREELQHRAEQRPHADVPRAGHHRGRRRQDGRPAPRPGARIHRPHRVHLLPRALHDRTERDDGRRGHRRGGLLRGAPRTYQERKLLIFHGEEWYN